MSKFDGRESALTKRIGQVQGPGTTTAADDRGAAVLLPSELDELVQYLIAAGYRVIGPTVREHAVVLDELSSAAQLPRGWGVDSEPGRYRLRHRGDDAVFGYAAGPQSWKQFLHPPRQPNWTTHGVTFRMADEQPAPMAFLGVRACDLAAIGVLNRVLVGGRHPDRGTARRMAGLFIVAVGCTEPGGVCFCASMGTGPTPGPGWDLLLTERLDSEGHRFVVEIGTDAGARVINGVRHRAAAGEEVAAARAAVAGAAERMGRAMPDTDLRTLLADSRDSAHWEDVAERCLTCGNCTMVCPTCFCTTVENRSDLAGSAADQSRRWASCFELDFSYLHGGSVRASGASRYRQWMTHKLSTWYDQFGSSGCVGCGRCIAWCPAGIDITGEASALASAENGGTSRGDR